MRERDKEQKERGNEPTIICYSVTTCIERERETTLEHFGTFGILALLLAEIGKRHLTVTRRERHESVLPRGGTCRGAMVLLPFPSIDMEMMTN